MSQEQPVSAPDVQKITLGRSGMLYAAMLALIPGMTSTYMGGLRDVKVVSPPRMMAEKEIKRRMNQHKRKRTRTAGLYTRYNKVQRENV